MSHRGRPTCSSIARGRRVASQRFRFRKIPINQGGVRAPPPVVMFIGVRTPVCVSSCAQVLVFTGPSSLRPYALGHLLSSSTVSKALRKDLFLLGDPSGRDPFSFGPSHQISYQRLPVTDRSVFSMSVVSPLLSFLSLDELSAFSKPSIGFEQTSTMSPAPARVFDSLNLGPCTYAVPTSRHVTVAQTSRKRETPRPLRGACKGAGPTEVDFHMRARC